MSSHRPSALARIAVVAAVPILVIAIALFSVLAQLRASAAPLPTHFVQAWGHFDDPIGVALTRSGTMYVIGLKPDGVEELWRNGRLLASWQTIEPALVPPPSGIAIDSRNRVYVCYPAAYDEVTSSPSSRIARVSPQGQLSALSTGSLPELRGPCPVSVDSHDRLWITLPNQNLVVRLTGERSAVWGKLSSTLLASPTSVAFDAQGRAIVSESGHGAVDLLGPPGVVLRRLGRYGSGPLQFRQPMGIAIDGLDRLYVADWGNNRVQILSKSGRLLGIVGRAGHGPGELKGPTAVALDHRGDLYVVDTGNNRVEEFAPAP
jgi:tripartite motif-containing protein 71